MKNDKQKNNVSSFIKENGFLIALYSIVGVLVVVAVSLTFMPTGIQEEQIVQLEQSQNVSTNLAKSYKTQIGSGTTETPKASEETNKTLETKPKSPELKTQTETQTETKTEPEKSITDTASIDMAKTTKNTSDLVIFEDDQVLNEAQPSMSFANDDRDNVAFNGEKTMLWPTEGDVVVAYSPETLVYDATLDQYKTTDSIDIATNKDEDVFAAYDGVVKVVSKSVDQGNYVVIDHGNGWVTTYSQLSDSMKVSVGDQVKKGQQIGSISEPTIKSVSLGTHLDFKVTFNDESVNPLEVLE